MRSKVQFALEANARFKGVRATVTQPGVVVLEGAVFDNGQGCRNASRRASRASIA